MSRIPHYKAVFSVKSDKSTWVDDNTIQVLYHQDDLKRFKEEVWKRDNHVCYICEKQMHRHHSELTVDHVTPKREGGSILPKNMATCCLPCNHEKGWRNLEVYTLHLILFILYHKLWWERRTING